jgi:hypothetical protein
VHVVGLAGASTTLVSHSSFEGVQVEDGDTAPFLGGRIGLRLGGRWGLELEIGRALEVTDRDEGPQILAAPRARLAARTIFPPPIQTELRRSHTLVSPAVWLSHSLAGRTELLFLAGVTFDRARSELEYDVRFVPLAELPPGVVQAVDGVALLVPSGRLETVVYDLGPMVGVDAHIGLGEHLHVVPSVRMHATEGVWTLRYTAGIGWTF